MSEQLPASPPQLSDVKLQLVPAHTHDAAVHVGGAGVELPPQAPTVAAKTSRRDRIAHCRRTRARGARRANLLVPARTVCAAVTVSILGARGVTGSRGRQPAASRFESTPTRIGVALACCSVWLDGVIKPPTANDQPLSALSFPPMAISGVRSTGVRRAGATASGAHDFPRSFEKKSSVGARQRSAEKSQLRGGARTLAMTRDQSEWRQ
jgi:hypothetical protein